MTIQEKQVTTILNLHMSRVKAALPQIQDRIYNLKYRWQDEKEYEDFEEYKTVISKIFEAIGYTVKSVSKSFKITIAPADPNQILKTEMVLDFKATSLGLTARLA